MAAANLRAVSYDPTHEFHLPEGLCMICKTNPVAAHGTCVACDAALGEAR